MLTSGTQCRTLPRYQSEEMKIFNILSFRVGIKPTTRPVYNRTPQKSYEKKTFDICNVE